MIDPRTGLPFFEDSAWLFIVELIDGGHAISTIQLDQPKGALGYVLVTAPPDSIYIKLQIGASTVIGRSFHYSTP